MEKTYFPNEQLNKIPCGIIVFENTAPWRIVYANEQYYAHFSNGNSETLNILETDLPQLSGIEKKLGEKDGTKIYYRCNTGKKLPRTVIMTVRRYDERSYIAVLEDITKEFNLLERLKREKEKFAMVLCDDQNMVFEDDVQKNVSVLYMQQEDGEIKTIKTKGIYEQLAESMVHPHEKPFFIENIYNEKEKMLSARMKINGAKDWKWYRIYRRFEYDDEGKIMRVYGVIRDVDDEKKREEEYRKKIEIDPVLKIYTRNAGVNKINSYIRNNPKRSDYALLIMDIDDFKNINDTYGHMYGDVVIEMTAGAIKEAVGDAGFAGRYGGDEFFAFVHSASRSEIRAVAEEILNKVKDFHLSDDTRITLSIGVASGDMLADTDAGYAGLLEKADKALYHVKENGKANWCEYNENMSNNNGRGLDYEEDEAEESAEMLDSKDMMKAFLELSAGAKTSDEAVYNIMKHIIDRFRFDWMQIMQVNSREDLITIRYEWCRTPDFRNNAGKSGYYVHSDIMNFRHYFENFPIFRVLPENIGGFSPKFQREFEKNMRYNVVYISNTTTDENFYMFVCTRFDKNDVWTDEETQELNMATKIMTMYIAQTGRESENEKKLQHMVDYDRKTDLYSISQLYVQMGRLRKIARENGEDVVLAHCDIGNFVKFNRDFGIEAGDDILLSYGKHIKDNFYNGRVSASHIDGTDIFYVAFRVKKGDMSIIEKYHNENIYFCNMCNEKYKGAELVIRTGVYLLKDNEDGGYGFDCAMLAKKYVKDRNRSFYVMYDDQMDDL